MKIVIKKDSSIKPIIKDLLEQPVVIQVNKFTEDSVKDFITQLSNAHNTGQPVIPIVIDSYGGNVHALLAMLAELENSILPVATIAVGKAMSAGAILLAHGNHGYRFIDESATVMIHEVGSSAWGKLEDMKTSVKETTRLNRLIFEKLTRACGHKDKNYFFKLIDKKRNTDWYLDAVEALKHKLVDHIGVPYFSVEVKTNMSLILRERKKPQTKKK